MAILGVLTMAEQFGGQGADAFTPMGAAVPGSPHEAAAAARRPGDQTEVFPLTLFSVGGMLLFPAAGDLLTHVRRARGALAAALPAVRAGPSPPPAVAGGVAEVLPARRVLLGVLPVRRGAALRLRRLALPRRHRRRPSPTADGDARGPAAARCACWCWSACCSRSARCRSTRGRPTSTRARPTPVTGFMAACTKVAAFGAILRVVYVGVEANRWDWRGGVIAVAALTMVVGAVLSVTQTDVKRHARLLLDRARRVHPGRRAGLRPHRRLGHDVLPRRLRLHDHRRVRRRLAGAPGRVRGHAPVAVGRPGPQPPGRGRRLRLPAAGLRGHPADLRLHREVRRVRAGDRVGGRSGVALVIIGVLCSVDRGVLLRPAHRADVLHRAAGR